jgi:type VI secretion system protein ImpG
MLSNYYEDEMHYLHEAGKEFAKAHPEQTKYLNIESVADRDPYVERLFEGFAFLTGRIREWLDDELPEYTESLFGLLWPHFLKPIPALSILEFQPKPGFIQETTVFERGTEVRSNPVGEESAICRFTTTQDVLLQPMKLLDTKLNWPPDGTTNLTLHFELDSGVDFQNLQMSSLRLFFHAEPTIASMMYLFFTRHVAKVIICAGDTENAAFELEGQEWIKPGGLTTEEGLLPYSQYSFSGYRLLQEYLSFRQKFWFVDLLGLEKFSPPPKTTEFQILVFFDRLYPEEKRFKSENIRLYCTPIVNLFSTDAEPVRGDHLVSEYRVIASTRQPRSSEVYNIEELVSVEEATGKRHKYVPYNSFKHGQGKSKDLRYFTSTTRLGPTERYETYIALYGFDLTHEQLPVETLSPEIACTNSSLPHEKLQERMITQPAPDFADIATFENLSQPTLDLHPPVHRHKDFFWKLISHMSFNHMSVASTEALAGLLDLYDWTTTDANQRRIEGLRSVSWGPKESIHHGAVIRGVEVTIEVQDGHFADEGDLCLFGVVMSEFFSLYATINSFVHLTLISMPSGRRYQWKPKGRMQII